MDIIQSKIDAIQNKDPTEANCKLKEIIADAFFCRVFGEWIVLTQRPVYIEVSLTGIAGLKSLTVITGLLLKARHKRGFWGNPVSQSMTA